MGGSRGYLAVSFFVALPGLAACGGSTHGAEAPSSAPNAQQVFAAVAPSVVAIVNDDRADRAAEEKDFERLLGIDAQAPKRIIDVSPRDKVMPDGTGFMIDGGMVMTAAHVVYRPDRLKITSRSGQTVDAELVRIDETRDLALLKPKTPLKDVPPLALEEHDVKVGEPVWVMGHTGQGYWELSWGMSQGIASGIVDLFGAKLLLMDARVYPGFSGGPVVSFHGPKPEVVGVNHAILYTGGITTAPVSSAVTVSEMREVVKGAPPTLENALVRYAAQQRAHVYADLFITDRLAVGKDSNGPYAHILGDARQIEADPTDTRIPCVAMIFALPQGESTVRFYALDPAGKTVASSTTKVTSTGRVAFANTELHFAGKTHGNYQVVAYKDGKLIGKAIVTVEQEGDGHAVREHDGDGVDADGDPDIDVVVAQSASERPFILAGIRNDWAEKSYPRRVGFTWFARGTRGWRGTNVVMSAFVLDKNGKIVGRADGCMRSQIAPEHPWSCLSSGSVATQPLVKDQGQYDIVFTLNDRPVAWWPMEAILRHDDPDDATERWMREMLRGISSRKK